MPKRIVEKSAQPKKAQPGTQPRTLKGWQQIAAFLGHPAAVVQRWASEGMPVRRQGRYVETTPDELNAWLGKESGKGARRDRDHRSCRRAQARTVIRSQGNAIEGEGQIAPCNWLGLCGLRPQALTTRAGSR